DREHVQADLFGLLRDLGDRIDPFGLAGRLARYRVPGDVADREDPELHGACLRYMRLHVPEPPEAAWYSTCGGPGVSESGALPHRFSRAPLSLKLTAGEAVSGVSLGAWCSWVTDYGEGIGEATRGGLMDLSQLQAVLLDMDGTLVDSDAAVERSWRIWA